MASFLTKSANLTSRGDANLTQLMRGGAMVKRIPQLPPEQVYPEVPGKTNLNCCGDPDCGNYGVAPDFGLPKFLGPGAAQRRLLAAASIPALTTGRGVYTQGTPDDDHDRLSSILDYFQDPHGWSDGRILICDHQKGNRTCGVQFQLLSNQHLEDETARLRSQNGVLTGPTCGACGRAYLDAPGEFAFNGLNGSPKTKSPGIRLIHTPCRGQPGARFTVLAEHVRQKDRSDNIRILSELVNEVGINALKRVLDPAPGASEVGVSRIYNRILWLERVLLAYEKPHLAQWRTRLAKAGRERHTRVAHDDIVLTANWETAKDTRVTALNCAVSADTESGYVFRVDVDFDPTVDPAKLLGKLFFDPQRLGISLRKVYTQAGGKVFPAPLMSFQRRTGRFDEPALFASAVASHRLFAEDATKALSRSTAPVDPAVLTTIAEARQNAWILEWIGERYFNFGAPEREGRNTFTGIMTRDIYTKAGHLACLKEMLPSGKLTLVGEQEGTMGRVVPHLFRDEILADRFEWHVVAFDKDAKKPEIVQRTKGFNTSFRAFRQSNPMMPIPEALHAWTRTRLTPGVKRTSGGHAAPFPGSNFASRAFPLLWIRSPIQAGGETDKTVGFPILSPRYRQAYRRLGFNSAIADPKLEAAI